MPDVKTLLPLQEIDGQLFRLRRDRDRKPAELASLHENVSTAKEEVTDADGALKELKVEASKHELEMKETEDKIKKYEQDSLKVKKNSEFLAIKKAISGIRADQSLITDKWLEVEARVEQADRSKQESDQDLKDAQAKLANEESRIQGEIGELDKQISSLEDKRSGARTSIDPEVLAVYERIIGSESKNGQALSQVSARLTGRIRKGEELTPQKDFSRFAYHCGACQTQLTMQDVNSLMMGRDVKLCNNCSRILYYAS